MVIGVESENSRNVQRQPDQTRPFQVLVGPNLGGKLTFVKALFLLSGVGKQSVPAAVVECSPNFYDLYLEPLKATDIAVDVTGLDSQEQKQGYNQFHQPQSFF